MATELTLKYDEAGDILYIEMVAPYAGQRSRETAEGVVVRTNPSSGVVESVEVQGFRRRASSPGGLPLPVAAQLLELAASSKPRRAAS
jgi:hypothetical protein